MTNLLSLEQFRREMGFHPWHFWGLANSVVPVNSACDDTVKKYAWQGSDAVGRNDIIHAIEAAEQKLRDYMGYWVAPKFGFVQVPYPKYDDIRVRYWGYSDAENRWISVRTNEGYIQSLGVELVTLLATVAVTYSDPDGDGINEKFSISTTTTQTDLTKIAVYFALADRLDSDAVSETYRIDPVKVVISGGTVTITGSSWLLVRPILYEGVATTDINPSTAGNFVSTLSIYTRTTNPQGITIADCQVRLEWETLPFPWWPWVSSNGGLAVAQVVDGGNPSNDFGSSTVDNSTDPASVGMAVGRAGIRDSKQGFIIPAQAVYNVAAGAWTSQTWDNSMSPDTITVRFRAGMPVDASGQMQAKLRTLVARMAAAELARPICACDTASRELYRWQFDMSRVGGVNDERYSISQMELENPFGTRRGHVWSWKYTKQHQIAEAFLA